MRVYGRVHGRAGGRVRAYEVFIIRGFYSATIILIIHPYREANRRKVCLISGGFYICVYMLSFTGEKA